MRWSPPSPFYGVDAPRDRCYASTGTERRQEETMNQSMTTGIDLAKHVFFIAALDGSGKPPRRKKLRRHEVLSFLANHPGAVVGMEACSGAHHWAREIRALGHGVQLLPAQHVKAYLRGQKNDYNDALAIAEAVQHGRIRCVEIKTVDQQLDQSLHRLRSEERRVGKGCCSAWWRDCIDDEGSGLAMFG